jgi:hypothetical protein
METFLKKKKYFSKGFKATYVVALANILGLLFRPLNITLISLLPLTYLFIARNVLQNLNVSSEIQIYESKIQMF